MEKFQEQVLGHIRSGRPLSDARFGELAIQTYLWQRANNPVYRRYCETSGAPERPARWQDIPALPVAAFKHHRIACFPKSGTRRTFMTSGTTRGQLRGKHPFDDLGLKFYDAAIRTLFGRYVLSDLKAGERIPMVFLTASGAASPESSLCYMGARIAREFGSPNPFYALGPHGIRSGELTEHLRSCVRDRRRPLIFTTTFALADYLDHLTAEDIRIKLPAGSRIMETGGYKGRRTEVVRAELLRQTALRLGIPARRVINEYGMTELSSQFYDGSLRGRGALAVRGLLAVKETAPWTQVVMTDPRTGRFLPDGRTGAIRIYDLANQGSCMAVQTEDLGQRIGRGFCVLGRDPGAPLRGCSLSFEALAR